MIDFSKDELLKLADLSGVQLDNKEIEQFEKELSLLITYASELEGVTQQKIPLAKGRVNVFRDDRTVVQCDARPLLEQAPLTEDFYFVVPKIL